MAGTTTSDSGLPHRFKNNMEGVCFSEGTASSGVTLPSSSDDFLRASFVEFVKSQTKVPLRRETTDSTGEMTERISSRLAARLL